MSNSNSNSSTTSTSRYRWRVVDIVVAAVLGVALGFIFVAWNFAGDAAGDFLKAILPPLKGLLGGVWLLGGVLGGLIIRKPGAAIFVELIAAIVSALIGNAWGLTVIFSGLLQGAGAELIFLIFLYKKWNLPIAMIAGALAAVFGGVYELFVWYAGWEPLFQAAYIGCFAVSGAILAGLLGWLLQKGLAKTDALNRFESGRESEQLV